MSMEGYEIKIKTIFSQQLAGYLMLNKFPLLGINQNHKMSTKKVFFFQETEELLEKMNEWLTKRA